MDREQSANNGRQVVITVPSCPVTPNKPMNVVRMIHWVATLCIMTCLVATLIVDKMRKTTIWGLEFWKWTLLAMEVLSGSLVVNCLTGFLLFMIKMIFSQSKKLLTPIYNFKKGVQMFIWIGEILLTWVCLFTHGVRQPTIPTEIVNLVTRTLIVLLVGSSLRLLKTLWLKIYAPRFLIRAYFGRNQTSVFHHHILKNLSEPPPTDAAVGRRVPNEDKKSTDRKLNELKQEVLPWTEKFLAGVITGASYFLYVSNRGHESVHDIEIHSKMKNRAAKAAKLLFGAGGSRYICKRDLLSFMIPAEADIVFPLFEGSETGKIGKQSWDNWVETIITERQEIVHALYEANAPVRQLNKIMSGVLVIVCIIIWLLLMKLTDLQTFGLLLTAVGFTFGNTCKAIAEAAIFVFAVHPFDVGDRCVVDDIPLLVKEMDIFTTVFLNVKNEKVYYPNSLLSGKSIRNCDRSCDVCTVEFEIDSKTPQEKIDLLKADIKRHMEISRQHWHPKHTVEVKETPKENKQKVTLYCCHKMNSQNFLKKNQRRSKLILEIKKIFKEHGVQSNLARRRNRFSLLESQIIAKLTE